MLLLMLAHVSVQLFKLAGLNPVGFQLGLPWLGSALSAPLA